MIERQVALEFFQVDQLIQPLAQGGLAFEQLLLIGRAHQEELAGGLIAGDARNGLGFVSQLLRCADPLADIVLALELQQAAGTKGNQQRQQHRRARMLQQRFAADPANIRRSAAAIAPGAARHP